MGSTTNFCNEQFNSQDKHAKLTLKLEMGITCPFLSICKMSNSITVCRNKETSWIFTYAQGSIPSLQKSIRYVISTGQRRTMNAHIGSLYSYNKQNTELYVQVILVRNSEPGALARGIFYGGIAKAD